MAQPHLSRQIAALERELGVLLFDRSKRRIKLTRSGETLEQDARRIIDEVSRAAERCRAASATNAPLRVDFVPSTFALAVPQILRLYQIGMPGRRLQLTERRPDEVVKSLDAGESDAGFVLQFKPRPNESLNVLTVLQEPLIAVVPATHRLAEREEIDTEELADEDFILNEKNPRGGLRETIEAFCESKGFAPRAVQEPWLQQTTLGLVGAGIGVTLTAQSARTTRHHNLRYLRLRDCTDIALTQLLWNPATEIPEFDDFIDAASNWSSSTADHDE